MNNISVISDNFVQYFLNTISFLQCTQTKDPKGIEIQFQSAA